MKLEFGKVYRDPQYPEAKSIRLIQEYANSNCCVACFINGSWMINTASKSEVSRYVEVKPYENFTVDQRVYVKDRVDRDTEWLPRYFSFVDENGHPNTFVDGTTSWSSREKYYPYTAWDECISEEEYEAKYRK